MSAGSITSLLVFQIRRRYAAAPAPMAFCVQRERTMRLSDRMETGAIASTGAPVRVRIGLQQPMQVDDKIPHLGVVHSLLRLRLPGRIRAGVVRINADDVEALEVFEFDLLDSSKFAAEHEMKQLLLRRGACGHQ